MTTSDTTEWFAELLGGPFPSEGQSASFHGENMVVRDGLLRAASTPSAPQAQTSDAFGFKWQQRDTFESQAMIERTRRWLVERYGPVSTADWWSDYPGQPLVLDAGCGGGLASLALFEALLPSIRYVGADISEAVDVARTRFAEHGVPGAFVQADLKHLPFPSGSFDVIFSEGVLHHTDSTFDALAHLTTKLRVGGRFMFYVYRRKGPVREFTDDHIREQLQSMAPNAAWDAVRPLTRLGQQLGELDVDVDIPEAIELLQIPAGPISVQRLFYWHVCKAYYSSDLTLEEMNHINFDWFAPQNAHRQSPEEVRSWCASLNLEIERENVQDAGITIVARRAC